MGLYLLLGFLGLPVFAGYSGGIHHFLDQQRLYWLCFSFVMGLLWNIRVENRQPRWQFNLAMVCGLAVCYLVHWFMYVMNGIGRVIDTLCNAILIIRAVRWLWRNNGNALRAALSKANLMHYEEVIFPRIGLRWTEEF